MEEMAEKDKLGKKIMKGLYKGKMILTWYRDKPEGWMLASNLWSPFFINLRLISSVDPKLYKLVGKAMCSLLNSIGFVPDGNHRVVGIAMAGIPLANAVTLLGNIPSLYTRKLPEEVKTQEDVETYMKGHGAKSFVEGEFKSGDKLALVDDIVTRFDSKLAAISLLKQEAAKRNVSIELNDVIVLIDREQGGTEIARQTGYNLYSLIPFRSKGVDWLKNKLSKIEYETITDYLKDPQKYQNKEIQERLKAQAKH